MILYCFYKNICLYIIEFWFAIYNYWSGQVLFERWTIGLYNLLFTSFPPIAMGLFDQHCTAETRMKYPSLYQATQNSSHFNDKTFWIWIANSILHSILLYWLPMASYTEGVVWQSGLSGDYLTIGNIVYTFVVITVCCKAGLEMDSWSWISHLSIWGSIALWFLFLGVYRYFWAIGIPLAANMAGMVVMVMTTSAFWLGLLLIPFATLIPDIAYKSIRTTVWPTETDKVRIAEIMKKDVSTYVSGGSRPGLRLTETSALLQNMRRVFSRSAGPRSTDGGVTTAGTGSGNAEEVELVHGYAFSQEEGGAVSQVEYIRRYDTTSAKVRKKRDDYGGT